MSPNATLEMPAVEDVVSDATQTLEVEDTLFGEQRVTEVSAQDDPDNPDDYCFCICSCMSRTTRTTNSQLVTAGVAAG